MIKICFETLDGVSKKLMHIFERGFKHFDNICTQYSVKKAVDISNVLRFVVKP